MADAADIAQGYQEDALESALAARWRPGTEQSLSQCAECGDTIPAARRRAIPGVQYCVPCTEDLERRGRI